MKRKKFWGETVAIILLQSVILLFLQAEAPLLLSQDYSALVTGVHKVVSPGYPGALLGTDAEWVAIVGGDDDASMPSTFVLARDLLFGRVLAVGHDGLFTNLNLLDNKKFMNNVIDWLTNSGPKSVRFTTGHKEWLGPWNLGELEIELKSRGYSFASIPDQITIDSLRGAGVLIVGNAWTSFLESEVAAVQFFVESGRGLLLVGTGWSWPSEMENYPMVVITKPYGLMWLRNTITDFTDQLEGSPVFSIFFPEVSADSIEGAKSDILAAYTAFPSNLHLVLEADSQLQRTYSHAHLLLSQIPLTFPAGSSERNSVFKFYRDLISNSFGISGFDYLRKSRIYDPSETKTMVFMRELFYRTWIESMDLTPAVKFEISDLGGFHQPYRDLFSVHGIYLLDNTSLSVSQLELIDTLLNLVPQELHNLAFVSVLNILGAEFPPGITGVDFCASNRGSVNIFGIDIGMSENSFPPDVSPGLVDIFTIIVVHELNHIVDAFTINKNPSLSERKNMLIEAAGSDSMNYLRSMFSDGFFMEAPQEFFASISNEWFTDSAKTLELGLIRFDGGRPHPLNQALFFAEVYCLGGTSTYFYRSDTQGNIERTIVPLSHDRSGHINRLTVNNIQYDFKLDSAGNVLAYTATQVAALPSESCTELRTSREKKETESYRKFGR